MSPPVPTTTEQRPLLVDVLHAAHMRIVLIAVLLAGLSIFVIGLLALRSYMIDNLDLSARTIAYALEAPVVFGDQEAAAEALAQVAANRPVSMVRVRDINEQEIAHWLPPEQGAWQALESSLAGLLLPESASERILHNGRPVGSVTVRSAGRDLLIFLMISTFCGLLCLALCASVASRLSRRASQSIAQPLQHLAAVAATARRNRQFEKRAGPADIAELQALGDDFNALLAELERWQEQMQQHNESLSYQANHDPLTGLANRAMFESSLDKALSNAQQSNTRLALFFIDGDRFKSINDEHGHEVGDMVLRVTARRLKAKVREHDLVARLGGDEFAVLLAPLLDTAQAERIAASLLESMASPIELPSGIRLSMSLSIGIAFYPDHAILLPELLKRADEAMYASKRAGRGTYALASDENSTKT